MLVEPCDLCGSNEVKDYYKEKVFTYLKCQSCGLIFRDRNDMDEMREFYKNEGVTEDGNLKGYYGGGDGGKYRWRVALDHIQRFKKSGQLFEIGCGGGGLMVEAKHRGFDVYGCDISTSRVHIMNKRLGGDYVTLGDFESIDLTNQKFDVIVMMDVISHFKSLSRAMNLVTELLAPGGILYLKGGNFGEFESIDELQREKIDLQIQIHLYHLTPNNIRMLLRRNRLNILMFDVIAHHRLSGGLFSSDRKNYLFQPLSDIIGKTLYFLRLRKASEVIVIAQK